MVCFSSVCADAQVYPPDFSCIRNDTLFWTPSQNNCGGFQAYRIYTAPNVNGPFSQLVEITNFSQVNYFHANPSDETRFYYLETIANCPGEVNLQSDTLDNLSPSQFPITRVSVKSDTLILEWEQSTSPEVIGYIIYRRTNLGTIPIDTVFQTTRYIDDQASPTVQSEQYFVIALDPCGNTSIFDLPHRSIFLQTQVIDCDPNIYLQWNLYENWIHGIEKQEVWASLDGGNPVLVEELGPMDTTFTYINTQDGQTYRFFIRAIALQTGYSAQSNTAERLLSIVQPINELAITHITVNSDETIDIEWFWNKEADLSEVFLQENSDDGNNESIIPLVVPSSNENRWNITPSFPLTDDLNFQIRTIDNCNRREMSNRARPMILSGEARRDLTNILNWNSYILPNTEVLEYQIRRVNNGSRELLTTLTPDKTTYIHMLDSRNQAEQFNCYIIEAKVQVQLPDGRVVQKITQSNQLCIQQFFTLLLPNAFAPDGRNNIFKPAIVFGENVEFEMYIFNRWGEQVYKTKNIKEGWNGRKEGVAMPGGVYIYWIKVRQPDGDLEEYKGFVTLIK